MSWGFGGALWRDPYPTFMYLPRAHIGPKADFGKISFAGPKNRFFTDWANITKRLKNVPRVFFEAILTPIQRGFILSNFWVDLKKNRFFGYFGFFEVSSKMAPTPLKYSPRPPDVKIESSHLGAP